MKLIVGLGNPGKQYEQTRHNAGFMAVTRLAKHCGLSDLPVRSKFHAAMIEGPVANQRCIFLLPQTYMNRSGLTVGEAVTFYKLDPASDLLVIVDDVALPLGRIRLRASGSDGGHNGLKDITRALGTGDYPRLRIGIDPPGRIPQVDYVTQRFSASQLDQLDPALDSAASAVEAWLTHGIDKAMSLFNAQD